VNRHCCKVGCADAAAFEIVHLTGNYEDTTDSCLTHVGDLLGSNGDAEWVISPIAPRAEPGSKVHCTDPILPA
jgi:hypothetical protein